MANKIDEQLSALLDGECASVEVELALRRLAKDLELKACWQRYHLISDALKNNLPETINSGFPDRIRQAIEETPPIATAPFSWRRPVIGWGLAASMALVALFGVQIYQSNSEALRLAEQAASDLRDREQASRLSSYLVNHNEYASMNSVHRVLPYVRIVGYETGR